MKFTFVFLLSVSWMFHINANETTTYKKMVSLCDSLTKNHPRVKSSEAILNSSEDQVKVALGAYYPNLNLDYDQSFTKLDNHASTNPNQETRSFGASISQLIYDFGKTNIDIQIALGTVKQNKLSLENTKQAILLEGLELCLDYSSTWQQVEFETQSAANFKQQMDLENIKVKKGQGYSTDVLQAEAQWLGAKNRKLQLQAALKRLESSFISLFGHSSSIHSLSGELIRKNNLEYPKNLIQNQKTSVPSSNLNIELISKQTTTQENTTDDLIKNNPRILSLKIAIENQELRKKSLVKNRFRPELTGSLASEVNQFDRSANPFQKETTAAIQLSFPLNLGFTALDEISSLSKRIYSLEQDYEDEKRQLINSLETHLINWETANQSALLLKRQAEISRQFLEGAEKERTMGRRSLIDVINGELILIRAKSSLEQAEIQALRSYFRYLNTIGNLQTNKL